MREKRYRCFIQLYRFFLVLFDNSLRFSQEGVGSMNIKKWSVSPLDKARAAKIAEEMQYPSFLAMMLEIRGFHTKDDIDALFDVSKSFADPFLMKDMAL